MLILKGLRPGPSAMVAPEVFHVRHFPELVEAFLLLRLQSVLAGVGFEAKHDFIERQAFIVVQREDLPAAFGQHVHHLAHDFPRLGVILIIGGVRNFVGLPDAAQGEE